MSRGVGFHERKTSESTIRLPFGASRRQTAHKYRDVLISQKAEQVLKKLPKKYAYAIYKLPLDAKLTKRPKLEDQQGIFDHWHYGAQEIECIRADDDGKIIDQDRTIELMWEE